MFWYFSSQSRINTFILSEMNCKTNRQRFPKILLFVQMMSKALLDYNTYKENCLKLFLYLLTGVRITERRKLCRSNVVVFSTRGGFTLPTLYSKGV